MTVEGILVINLIALALLLWILNLVRTARLYVGYGLMFIFILVFVIGVVSVPRLLDIMSIQVARIFPSYALTVIALSFIVFLLIYILTQLTILSNRLANLVQEIAIRNAREEPGFLATETDNRMMQDLQ